MWPSFFQLPPHRLSHWMLASCQNVVHGIVLAAESAEALFFEGLDVQPVRSKLLYAVESFVEEPLGYL